jgi:hypothetical protein
MTANAVLRRRHIEALHTVMAMFAEIPFRDHFPFHLVTGTFGKFVKVTDRALQAARLKMVIMTELNGIGILQIEGYISSAQSGY